MRPKSLLVLAVACWSLTALASPGLAEEVKDAAGPAIVMAVPATCNTLSMDVPQPLFMACTVQVECANSSVISCSGNTCSTGGSNNSCVICNGVQQSCCPGPTCCQMCEEERIYCLESCELPAGCKWCNTIVYPNCIAGCTGGCS